LTEQVLVTGATGFIGHHLVGHLLQLGHQVTCLVRPTSDLSGLDQTRLRFVQGDLTGPDSLATAVAGVAVVYHLGGALTARRAQDFHRVNADGPAHLAAACARRPNPPTLVLLSSLAAAGPSPAGRSRTELDPPAPVSDYGRSKLAGEQAAARYAGRLPVTIVRAGWVFGEWDRDTLRIFRLVGYGLHPVPVAPSNRYSMIHGSDLAALLVLAAECGERCAPDGDPEMGLYYAAAEPSLDYAGIGRQVAAALGRGEPRIVHLPRPLTLALAGVPQMVSNLLNRPPSIVNLDKAREGFTGSWDCSPEKARLQLGFTPAASMEERMRQTASWYQQQGWL
jgi:nucleoside-diphosphate-sugar epimerase